MTSESASMEVQSVSVSRRELLTGAAALAVLGRAGGWAPAAHGAAGDGELLRARPGTARLVPPGYPETPIWGYEGQVPGPAVRLRQGERVRRRFANELPEASTVHWHGIRLANAMDGAPGVTQDAVPPGAEFLYDFVAPDAGTFWYHPHERAFEQMARGLYGALVVEEPDPPQVDRDQVLLLDDWRLTEQARIHEESFGALGDWSHAGRTGNWITVNGDGAWTRTVAHHERLRLRLVNVANARIFSIDTRGLDGWLVALDGQPLAKLEPPAPLVLAPGQRADLVVDVVAGEGEKGLLFSREREGTFILATFAVSGVARATRLPVPSPLPANPVTPLGELGRARHATLRMEGGAMGRLRQAVLDGTTMPMRDLAARGKVWAMNGLAQMPQEPLFAARRGETVLLTMINDSAWPHGMHLHGHHFRPLSPSGEPGPLRDTVLTDPDETLRIAFVADNPGDWLLHCHMLEHSVAGMLTWFRVA